MSSTITVEKGEPQLFVDDLLIESQENLKRTLHQPKKDNGGNFPILQLPPDFFGDILGTLMANGTIGYDPKINKYVMFALAFAAAWDAKAVDGWKRVKLLRYTSDDGLGWNTNPDGSCEVVYPISQKEVQYGKSLQETFHLDLFSCHYDLTNEKYPYQGWIFLRGREEETGIYHMRSTDGKKWKRGRLVLQRFTRELRQDGTFLMGPGDVSLFSADAKSNRFLGSFKFQNFKGKGTEHLLRSRAYLFVDRLDALIDPRKFKRVDQVPPQKKHNGDEPNDEYYASTAWRYGSHWLGGLKVFHVNGDYPYSSSGCAFLKMHCSRNGLNWNKLPFENDDGVAEIFLSNGKEGDHNGLNDGGYLTEFTNAPLIINNELIFYYGNSSYGKNHPDGVRMTGGGIFRARLKRDGFVSVDNGSLTTHPFNLPGNDLYINHCGEIQVNVLNQSGKLIASSIITSNDSSMDTPVLFSRKSLKNLFQKSTQTKNISIKLQINIKGGNHFYSFYIK